MDDNLPYSRKIDANRRNALKSTGPKTEKGKRVSRWNPLKHGLLAREVVIQTGEKREDPAEFKSLLTQLGKSLEPKGVLEEMMVEGIAVCYWRWRRAIRCEAGEIATAEMAPSSKPIRWQAMPSPLLRYTPTRSPTGNIPLGQDRKHG